MSTSFGKLKPGKSFRFPYRNKVYTKKENPVSQRFLCYICHGHPTSELNAKSGRAEFHFCKQLKVVPV